MLTPEERRIVFQYCWEHPVAACPRCGGAFKLHELGTEPFGPSWRSDLCPSCRIPLTAAVRGHIAACSVLLVQAAEFKERAQAARREAQELQKTSQQLRDRSEVLSAEASSAIEEAVRVRQDRNAAREEPPLSVGDRVRPRWRPLALGTVVGISDRDPALVEVHWDGGTPPFDRVSFRASELVRVSVRPPR